MRIRAHGHDPGRGPDLLDHRLVVGLDRQDRLDVELLHVRDLAVLRGERGVVLHEATDLVPDEALDLEAPGVVLFHQAVVGQRVAQVSPPTDVALFRLVARAVVAIPMEGQVGDPLFAPCCRLAGFQEVVQPAHVVGHGRPDELGVPLSLSDDHVVRPLLGEGLRVAPQVEVVARLARVVRLVPALHHGPGAALVRGRELLDAHAQGVPRLLDHRHELDAGRLHICGHPPIVVPYPLSASLCSCRRQVFGIVRISVLSVDGDAAESAEGRLGRQRLRGAPGEGLPELDQRRRLGQGLARLVAGAAPRRGRRVGAAAAARCHRARGRYAGAHRRDAGLSGGRRYLAPQGGGDGPPVEFLRHG
mmetsp:Transcript_120264/g.336745  ORF Transcript_120264/g.336745 Transcript_120264/m.336745 type:complete len:361 (+) Transcript_120264:2317-3399(+)